MEEAFPEGGERMDRETNQKFCPEKLREGFSVLEQWKSSTLVDSSQGAKVFPDLLNEYQRANRAKDDVQHQRKPQGAKFWDHIPYTRVVEWARDFKNAVDYVILNILESKGLVSRRKAPALQNSA